MTTFFCQNLAQSLGWTVLHSVWQIGLVWLGFQVFRAVFQSPRALYFGSMIAIFIVAGWSVQTFYSTFSEISAVHFSEKMTEAVPAFFEKNAESAAIFSQKAIETGFFRPFFEKTEKYASLIGWAWMAVFSIIWLRILGGFWLSQKLRNLPAEPVSEEILALFENLKKRLGAPKNTRLRIQKMLPEPLTLGFWRPVVLFPAACLMQLSPAQVEALLMHELAHIRRHDYLLNLVQVALEACFFYHPLFWLLSKTARNQREICCDDLVVGQKTDRLVYANALTDLALLPVFTQNRLAMTAVSNGQFSQRIARIMGVRAEKSSRQPLVFWAAGLVLVAFLANAAVPKTGIFSKKITENVEETPLPLKARSGFLEKEEPRKIIEIAENYRSGAVSVADFQKISGVMALFPELPIAVDFEVVGYSFTLIKKGNNQLEFTNSGAGFSEKIQGSLKNLAPGDLIFIDNILCKTPGETKPRNLGGLFYKII